MISPGVMKSHSIPLLFTLLLVGFHAQASKQYNALSLLPQFPESISVKNLKWVDLLDEHHAAGWSIINQGPNESAVWKLESDIIIGDSSAGVPQSRQWYAHETMWEDFILHVEFQVDASLPANSGIHFRSRFSEELGKMQGPLVATDSDKIFKNGMVWDAAAKSSKWLSPVIPKGVRPSAEFTTDKLYIFTSKKKWNRLILACSEGKIWIYINNVLVNQFDGSSAWGDEVHKELGVGLKGHFAIEIDKKRPARFLYRNFHVAPL